MTKEKKKSIHIILDLETLGVETDAIVTQVSGAEFSLETGEISNVFNELLDFDSIDELRADIGTLRFWLRNEHNAEMFKNIIKRDNGGVSEKELWRKFSQWLSGIVASNEDKDVKIWGNGIGFDVEKVKFNVKKHHQPWPLNYANERDVRTFVDLATMITNQDDYSFKKSITNDNPHDALADIEWEAAYLSKAYHIIMGDKSLPNEPIEVKEVQITNNSSNEELESAWRELDD